MTFGDGAHKRHRGRYYFSAWQGVGSDSELTDNNSYNPPVKNRSRPIETQSPVVLLGVGAVRHGNDTARAKPGDSVYEQETTH